MVNDGKKRFANRYADDFDYFPNDFGRSQSMIACEDCLSLDVRRWSRKDWLRPGSTFTEAWTIGDDQRASVDVRVFAEYANINYFVADRATAIEQQLRIVSTLCHLGGSRKWFLCPGRDEKPCERRVAIVYLATNAFCCRECLRLKYLSQNESRLLRGVARAQKLRMKLGGTGNLMEPFPLKPPGMHWKTYHRLRARAVAREQAL